MNEDLVKELELAGGNTGLFGYGKLLRDAAAEIRRLDVIIREGQRQTHNEMYGRSSNTMVIPRG